MTVDGRGDAGEDLQAEWKDLVLNREKKSRSPARTGSGPPHPLPDSLVLRQGDDRLDVLVCELRHGDALVPASDVIGQDHRGEHGEAVCRVQRAVVVVVVDPSQLLARQKSKQKVNAIKDDSYIFPRKVSGFKLLQSPVSFCSRC